MVQSLCLSGSEDLSGQAVHKHLKVFPQQVHRLFLDARSWAAFGSGFDSPICAA